MTAYRHLLLRSDPNHEVGIDRATLSVEWIIRPIRAVFFADEQAFNWIQTKLGLSNDQMAALV